MGMTLIHGCRLWDATRKEPEEGIDVLVEGDRIKEVSDRPIKADGADRIDADGRTLIPGLIDAHVHVTSNEVNLGALREEPLTLMTARASRAMRQMLDRGFTTVRDCGGADWGLAQAVERGLTPGPRLFFSGRALSQTGGHGDYRPRTSDAETCACANALDAGTRIADGVPEVRRAARDELRKGATQIKVMVSGGVSSPNDPIENRQYSPEELRAIVEEAESWDTYVAAHAYTPRSIKHAVASGIRTIEHGNLIDREAAEAVAARDAFLVPTLVTFDAMNREGEALGLRPESLAKLPKVLHAGLEAIEFCLAAGVKLGFGTDLLGELRANQSREFSLRAEAQSPRDVLASATAVNAEILGRTGELGVIAPGAMADLLLVDGDPLSDLNLLQEQGRHLALIMKAGVLHKASAGA